MLRNYIPKIYKVKLGQKLKDIESAFHIPVSVLIKANNLKRDVFDGEILIIPKINGNLYEVRVGDTPTLLCGSDENFINRNGVEICFPGQKIFL